MIKKYITKLPYGRKKQDCVLLGRPYTLIDGKIESEGVLTKVYASYFRPYTETKITDPVKPSEVVKEEPKVQPKEEPKEENITVAPTSDLDTLIDPKDANNNKEESEAPKAEEKPSRNPKNKRKNS